MLKTNKNLVFDASKPHEKAILLFLYSKQYSIINDEINIKVHHFYVNSEEPEVAHKTSPEYSILKMGIKEFDSFVKKSKITSIEEMNQEKFMDSVILKLIGNQKLFGLKSEDLEVIQEP